MLLLKMMSRIMIVLLAMFLSIGVAAHHSRANFNQSEKLLLQGTITDYAFRNPHVFIEIDAPDAGGEMRSWLVEAHSVTAMRRNNWDAKSLKIGDQVTLSASPDVDESKHFVLLDYVEKTDGERLYAFRNPNAVPLEKRIEPSTDFSGTWSLDFRLFNTRLAGGGPPDWPYTAAAQEMVDQFNVDQNPELQCEEIGVPRISIYPYGTNIYREDDKIRIQKEHLNERRVIWLDSESDGLDDQPARYVGTSVGRFESDRHLVVESWGFIPTRWGSANGVDSSDQKKVTEEYVLADDGMSIDISVTIEDPVYMTAAVEVVGRYLKDENREFVEIPCDERAASRHLEVE